MTSSLLPEKGFVHSQFITIFSKLTKILGDIVSLFWTLSSYRFRGWDVSLKPESSVKALTFLQIHSYGIEQLNGLVFMYRQESPLTSIRRLR
jgi:hypothetical protein